MVALERFAQPRVPVLLIPFHSFPNDRNLPPEACDRMLGHAELKLTPTHGP
jgi:hypothetical protein